MDVGVSQSDSYSLPGSGRGPLSSQSPSGSASMTGNSKDDMPNRSLQYTMPGILHFLQTEWARFEMDRAQWEIDRSELQARIAFLQGERKGQENLKHDLVRRIKMLEYALKQERNKFHKLKYGTELEPADLVPPTLEKENKDDQVAPAMKTPNNTNNTWKQGRQLLRQYLQEIGYTDTIIDVRSTRVRQLLGLQPHSESAGGDQRFMNGEVQGGKRSADLSGKKNVKKLPMSMAEAALIDSEESIMSLDFLRAQQGGGSEGGDDDSDGDEVQDEEFLVKRPKSSSDQMMVGLEDVMTDSDTEQALAEFDFLVSENNEALERKDGTEGEEWSGVDQQALMKLKEQYKRERQKDKKHPSPSDRPKKSALQAMLVNLDNEEDMPALQSGSQSPPRSASNSAIESVGTKSLIGGMPDDDALEAALGLGELAGLTVNNEADSIPYSVNAPGDMQRKTWTAKYTLRSHFDGIRALVFHPVEPVLITASEDNMLKLWNLQKTVPAKRAASLDVEPVYTFRGHSGPVLCLAMSPTGESCYSGGLDGTICCWNIPNSNIDPYDSYDPSVLQSTLIGHTNAVWGMSMNNTRMHLLSCSSDATVRLWNPASKTPLINTYKIDSDPGVPTSVDFVRCESNQVVLAYDSSNAYVFDTEKGKAITLLESKQTSQQGSNNSIYRVICHPTLPVTITAHDDRHIRFFDNNSGKMIHSMVAHLDAVTSLAIDPSGLYILSGSHDCSIRLWNLETKTCVQEITSHRKKFDEAIHDVAFHPTKPFIASAGADALAKVFV